MSEHPILRTSEALLNDRMWVTGRGIGPHTRGLFGGSTCSLPACSVRQGRENANGNKIRGQLRRIGRR